MHPGELDQGIDPQERHPGRKRDTRKAGLAERQRDPLEWMQSEGNTATATTAEKGTEMTENNNTATAGAIYGVTAEDLQEHRAELRRQRDEAYSLYLQTPRPEDQPHKERADQLSNLMSTWDNMSDAERAEVIADERTKAATPAEPQLPELVEAVANRQQILEDADTLRQAVAKLIELELGNEQKAEAMSTAQETIRTQGDRINGLLNAQITGDDHRLAQFWETAGELAESAGYCDQYDHLCEQLGGVPRRKEFTVSHSITVSVTVSAYTSQTASADPDSSDFAGWSDYNSASDLEEEVLRAVRNGDFTIEEEEIQDWEQE